MILFTLPVGVCNQTQETLWAAVSREQLDCPWQFAETVLSVHHPPQSRGTCIRFWCRRFRVLWAPHSEGYLGQGNNFSVRGHILYFSGTKSWAMLPARQSCLVKKHKYFFFRRETKVKRVLQAHLELWVKGLFSRLSGAGATCPAAFLGWR